jgi:3-hydroxybutyryl-CoA dehydratase
VKIGDSASLRRRYTAGEVEAFLALTGPDMPAPGMPAPVMVPEPLLAGLLSYLLGVKVPGPGTNYLKQALVFHHPVPIGVETTARVTITRLRPEKHLCDLETTLHDAEGLGDGEGRLLASGRALVLVRDVARA